MIHSPLTKDLSWGVRTVSKMVYWLENYVGEVTDGDADKDGEFVTSQAVDREIEAGYKSVHPSVKIIVLRVLWRIFAAYIKIKIGPIIIIINKWTCCCYKCFHSLAISNIRKICFIVIVDDTIGVSSNTSLVLSFLMFIVPASLGSSTSPSCQ